MCSERFEPRGTVGGAAADPRLQRASDTSSTRRQVTSGVTSESYARDHGERPGGAKRQDESGPRERRARHARPPSPLLSSTVAVTRGLARRGKGDRRPSVGRLGAVPGGVFRAVVREAVRAELTDGTTVSTAAPLVDRHELARLLGVSAATITRMTAEGMPHVFAGASPRYAPEEVRAWLATRGRKGTKTKGSKATVAGVRLLSRAPR